MKAPPTMATPNTTGAKPIYAATASPDLTNHGFLPVNSRKAATPTKPPTKPTAQSGARSTRPLGDFCVPTYRYHQKPRRTNPFIICVPLVRPKATLNR